MNTVIKIYIIRLYHNTALSPMTSLPLKSFILLLLLLPLHAKDPIADDLEGAIKAYQQSLKESKSLLLQYYDNAIREYKRVGDSQSAQRISFAKRNFEKGDQPSLKSFSEYSSTGSGASSYKSSRSRTFS
ncbi:MAG: hypothetical protein HQL32_16690, partial [Planctomycetes bacterium]|nr:hypothetical protein [Planctomycetota bacterium]